MNYNRVAYKDLPQKVNLPRREFIKPIGRRWSEYIFGRRLNIAHFEKYGWVRVRAYRTRDGKIFYTDPIRNHTRYKGHSFFIGTFLVRKREI